MSRTIIKRIEIKPLTEEQKLRLKQLNDLPDSEIDTSDAPELPSIAWVSSEKGKFYKPTKSPVTARIDNDVVDWLKSKGRGYQTKMNEILRTAMLEDKKNQQK
ncbi:BrnA antitoxin family protein [Providencia hangzhouensis]|uniref:BrnA antitoxin family protein n=1 Tax=Providencia hangzhouensis TaxID=3031799 RepID=UPI0034DD432A